MLLLITGCRSIAGLDLQLMFVHLHSLGGQVREAAAGRLELGLLPGG